MSRDPGASGGRAQRRSQHTTALAPSLARPLRCLCRRSRTYLSSRLVAFSSKPTTWEVASESMCSLASMWTWSSPLCFFSIDAMAGFVGRRQGANGDGNTEKRMWGAAMRTSSRATGICSRLNTPLPRDPNNTLDQMTMITPCASSRSGVLGRPGT